MLYFACPTRGRPFGGIEKIHQFVGALERAGIPAAVVHEGTMKPSLDWLDSAATTLSCAEARFDPEGDVLVIPEVLVAGVNLPRGSRFVILDQAPYRMFARFPMPESGSDPASLDLGLYADPGLLAVVCVSDDSERFLRFAFPQVDVRRIHVGVDTTLFAPGERWRSPALACMPRKRQEEIAELFYVLSSRRQLGCWPPRMIDGLSRRGVAEALRGSPIFLNFPIREGFGLPALEAMASGCIVIGYTGRGGSEYLLPEVAHPISEGDSVEFAQAIENAAAEYEGRSARLVALMDAGVDLVRERYTLERQDEEVIELFAPFGQLGGSAGPARLATVPMSEILPISSVPSRGRLVAHHSREALRALLSRKPRQATS